MHYILHDLLYCCDLSFTQLKYQQGGGLLDALCKMSIFKAIMTHAHLKTRPRKALNPALQARILMRYIIQLQTSKTAERQTSKATKSSCQRNY